MKVSMFSAIWLDIYSGFYRKYLRGGFSAYYVAIQMMAFTRMQTMPNGMRIFQPMFMSWS